MWPFEVCDENGNISLNQEAWTRFRLDKELEYRHNWLHRRLFMLIHTPKSVLRDCRPIRIQDNAHQVNFVTADWSIIFEPFPAHFLGYNQPSFHIYLEDKHQAPTYGEPVTLLSTGKNLNSGSLYALFRNNYWTVQWFVDQGLGTVQPKMDEIHVLGTKKQLYRSIDDP